MLHRTEAYSPSIDGTTFGTRTTHAGSITHTDTLGHATGINTFSRRRTIAVTFRTLAVWHTVDLVADDFLVKVWRTTAIEIAGRIDARRLLATRRTLAFINIFAESFVVQDETIVALANGFVIDNLASAKRGTRIHCRQTRIFTPEVVAFLGWLTITT